MTMRMDSKLMQFLTKMAYLMWINLLTVFCSLPVITAGAAFTAMNDVLLRVLRDEEAGITKGYFKAFRRNFRQATAIWLIFLGIGGMTAFGFVTAKNLPGTQVGIYRILLMVFGVFFLSVCFYTFPLLSHFENTVAETLKNAFFLMNLNKRKTLQLLIIWGGLSYFMLRFFMRIIPLLLVFCFTLPAFLALFTLDPVFRKLEGAEQ